MSGVPGPEQFHSWRRCACGAQATRVLRRSWWCASHGPSGTCLNCGGEAARKGRICEACHTQTGLCMRCGERRSHWLTKWCDACLEANSRRKAGERKRRKLGVTTLARAARRAAQ